MTEPSQRLHDWLLSHQINAELLSFDESVHSVEQAIAVSGHPIERITKSIVMLTAENHLLIAMVPAKFRASTERIRKQLQLDERPRPATAEEIEARTGQRAGGNSPLNVPDAKILIDPKVLDNEWILTGGGDDRHLIKIPINELKRAVTFTEARVRK